MVKEPRSQKLQQSWVKRLTKALMYEPENREQLIELLRETRQRNLLDADTLIMLESVLQISELQVRDIMIPRAQMVTISENYSFEKILQIVTEAAHSRYPVMTENQEEVTGILLAKDLLKFALKNQESFRLADILRKAVFIPESKRLNVLLKEFRTKRNHLAIVVDEYGSISGIVTIEDVLEQIVGDIEDEFDINEESYIKKHTEQEFIIKAITPISEFNHYFGTQLQDEEFDTVGGLVLHNFGKLPNRNEITMIGRYAFEVLSADHRRIRLLKLTLPE